MVTRHHHMGLPVFRSISSSMHAGATTPTEPLGAVAISPNGGGLPRKPGGSASATSAFEACSAFTHVPACMFAKSPKVTRTQSTSTNSLPPSPLWLLPAERPIGRVGFAPTGDRRLFTAYWFSGTSWGAHDLMTHYRQSALLPQSGAIIEPNLSGVRGGAPGRSRRCSRSCRFL